MQFIDLHVHFLPGIDDGPSSLADSLAMLERASAAGSRTLVATPHMFHPDFDNRDPRAMRAVFTRFLSDLKEAAQERRYAFLRELDLYLGAENHLSPEFFAALASGEILPINAGNHVLVELPQFLSFDMAFSAVERIRGAGYFPILAHVERYDFFRRDPRRLESFIDRGCLVQVNASSIVGGRDRRLFRFADRILDDGLVHVIASDGHGTGSRTPDLGQVWNALRTRYPEETVAKWMWENAATVLAGKGVVREITRAI